MKLIHTADLHLDSNLNANLDKDKAKERRSEILNTFTRLVNFAVSNSVEGILISGDLFDTRNISATARNTVLNAIRSNSQIFFFYLRGNHDNDNFISGMDDIPDNLKLFDESIVSYSMGQDNRVVITGTELSERNSNTFYDSLFLNNENINIVMLHGQLAEAASKDKAEIINIRALRNKNIDYLALGHIHSYKMDRLDPRAVMCYPGCLDPRGFDETGEHGFVLININERTHEVSSEFVPFASRHLHEVACDISCAMSTPQIIDIVSETLANSNISDTDLVKIVLTGALDVECEKDAEVVFKSFENDYWFVKLYDETTLKVDYNDYLLDKSLKGEFVRCVNARTDISEEDKARIIRYGITVIQGGTIEACD